MNGQKPALVVDCTPHLMYTKYCYNQILPSTDKSCKYDGLKLSHGEKLTDASCAVVMECRNGFLHDKQCPGPPPVPRGCINPSLKVKRIPGECCEMNWTCDIR